MKKIIFQIGILIILIILLGLAFAWKQYSDRPGPYDATYMIDGKSVTLKDGVSIIDAAPGSISKITTRVFGNEVRQDLDGDGRDDVAFILTQDGGGSGTFYYFVAKLMVGLNTMINILVRLFVGTIEKVRLRSKSVV